MAAKKLNTKLLNQLHLIAAVLAPVYPLVMCMDFIDVHDMITEPTSLFGIVGIGVLMGSSIMWLYIALTWRWLSYPTAKRSNALLDHEDDVAQPHTIPYYIRAFGLMLIVTGIILCAVLSWALAIVIVDISVGDWGFFSQWALLYLPAIAGITYVFRTAFVQRLMPMQTAA